MGVNPSQAKTFQGTLIKGVTGTGDSDDSESTPVIVFTQDDDNTDWQKERRRIKNIC